MNIKPLQDRIVILPNKVEEKTPAGIILPETSKEKPMQGKVLAVGEGIYNNGTKIPMQIKVGDVVLYNKFSGNNITISDQEVLIMRESEILAIID